MQPISNSGNLHTVSADKSFAYILSPTTEGYYYLSQGSYPPYTVNGKGNNVNIQRQSADGAVWQIKPVSTYDVKLNSQGVALMYVDFDTRLPEGVSAYIADHVDANGVISLLQLTDVVPHSTAVVLRGPAATTAALGVGGREIQPYDGANILTGTLAKKQGLPKGTCYSLKSSGGQAVMKTSPIATTIAENKAYIQLVDGMPKLDTYTFDFENIIDNIKPQVTTPKSRDTSATYDLMGRKTDDNTPGVVIKDGNKILNR